MLVLVVNVGSTSFKFRLFRMPDEITIAEGKIDRVGSAKSTVTYQSTSGRLAEEVVDCPSHQAAIERALSLLMAPGSGVLSGPEEIDAVGFKPVHAKGIADAVRIDDDVIAAMQEYVLLAPAHNPPYIEAFRIFRDLLPSVPLIGVFEAAFHHAIPDEARTYGIPYEWTREHAIRRYGFHGASHRYVSLRVPQLMGRPSESLRIISCHLGGSSSVCAINGGVSVDTSMGFSPQSGLLNATRNGDLDPFALLYLMQKEGLSVDDIAGILCTNGGLKGISGLSGDVRDLERAAAEGNRRAELALRVLAYETRKYIGAYFAVLGGLDALAFTGGIGENATSMRARICTGLGHLGIELDPIRNQAETREGIISTDGSPVRVAVVAANEELIIARETVRVLA